MTKSIIDQAVDKFLGWKLPNDFAPDAGISFKAEFNEHTQWPMKHEPSGTNLFTAAQAKAMFEYCLGDAVAAIKAAHLAELTQGVEMPEPVAYYIDGYFTRINSKKDLLELTFKTELVTLDQCREAVASAVARKEREAKTLAIANHDNAVELQERIDKLVVECAELRFLARNGRR